MATRSSEFLTPIRATDRLVIFGSGNKLHVADGGAIDLNKRGGYKVTARCGRHGRIIRDHLKGRLPQNTTETYSVCYDCREFCRGVSG